MSWRYHAGMRDINRTRLVTVICCLGVVITGLTLENSVLNFCVAAALCIGSLSYGSSVYGSRTRAAKLFLLNAALLALIFVLLRATLDYVALHFPVAFWQGYWLHRIYRVWWLSERSAIILALITAGLVTIEVASKVGGDAVRKKMQWSIIGTASLLVGVNIVHVFRPASCADCFFPYGLPFTLFREGGYQGGAGFIWTGLVADAALIPAFATVCTLLWNQMAK